MTNNSIKGYKYISKWLKKANSTGKGITRDELSALMGINKQTLKKDLNGTRSSRLTQDYLIAICSQLGIDSNNTNTILKLYDFKPLIPKDLIGGNQSEFFYRDSELMRILDENSKNRKFSIDEINDKLYYNSLKRLDIPGCRTKKITSDFIILGFRDRINMESGFYDQYNQLEGKYSIRNYSCISYALLQNKKSMRKYELSYDNKGRCIQYSIKKDGNIDCLNAKKFNKIESTGKYAKNFYALEDRNEIKVRELKRSLDDTRNYKERSSANFDEDSIKIFIESFNYSAPELNEYYFIEYYNGFYRYMISNRSMFLYTELKKDEYTKEFGHFESKNSYSSNSVDDVIGKYHAKQKYSSDICDINCEIMRKEFTRLKSSLYNLKDKLKRKEVLIRNSKYNIDINYEYWIACYYHLEDSFGFTIVENEYENLYEINKDSIIYNGILISIDELSEAFDLGVDTIEQVIDVKTKYGKVSNVLSEL